MSRTPVAFSMMMDLFLGRTVCLVSGSDVGRDVGVGAVVGVCAVKDKVDSVVDSEEERRLTLKS